MSSIEIYQILLALDESFAVWDGNYILLHKVGIQTIQSYKHLIV